MTTFPVQIAQEDNVTPADISINTAVTLYADGRIQVNSQAQEWTDLHGGHVGVVVLHRPWCVAGPAQRGLPARLRRAASPAQAG